MFVVERTTPRPVLFIAQLHVVAVRGALIIAEFSVA